jgi:phage regulator Rha-like protein
MQELTKIERNDIFTNTYIIAQNTERDHGSITYNVKKYRERLEKLGRIYSSATQINKRGRPVEIYDLNEQQAVFLMTLMDNSEKVLDFKMKLASQFVAMRKLLLERQTAEWQQARTQSKQIRMQETDAIKQLVEYAKTQGSQNYNMLYMTYSKLVKSLVGYDERNNANSDTLIKIMLFETTLFGIISEEMVSGTHYKAIYAKAKQELTKLRSYWSRPLLRELV